MAYSLYTHDRQLQLQLILLLNNMHTQNVTQVWRDRGDCSVCVCSTWECPAALSCVPNGTLLPTQCSYFFTRAQGVGNRV